MAALSGVPSGGNQVATPSYERSRVRTGVVHLGVEGFRHPHQAGLKRLLGG